MEFVVTHLTRMEYPNICIAGVDYRTLENVRIVLPFPQAFTHVMLAQKGGPFDLGARLEVGEPLPHPRPPEVEDHQITLRKVRKLGYLSKESFWQLVANKARENIASVFGPTLEKTHQTYSSAAGEGHTSLGFLRLKCSAWLWVREFEDRTKIVLMCREGECRLMLPVTDLRLHALAEGFPVDKAAVYRFNRMLESASSVVLSVGLTRVWSGRHWLQVNNLHVEPS
ncbi:hypothetical protein C3F09_00750 [candidate division GN15 bacterium]|uniref:Dual OB-containing domain-containing protein n=1 Tax=candidate division GN15 bacterium TaxID=2072418 RepID=A0A855XBV3_9BACT|nr:MAG: hypothetical protein C3F09_00750 [candidate division GN15 bacterium]